MRCDCDNGYTYFASIVGDGEPTRSACSVCRPDEAAHESRVVAGFLIAVALVLFAVATV